MVNQAIIHAVANCLDCVWREEDYLKDVHGLAREHAKNKRHKVELEQGYFIDGTKPSSQLKAFGIIEEGYEDDTNSTKGETQGETQGEKDE